MPAKKAKKAKPKRFPKRELNTWLRKHSVWNHQDWLELLESLRKQGFEQWTDNEEGAEGIGLYLETNRNQG